MGAIFGKKKVPSRITAQDRAILQLKQQRDQLRLYQKRIESQLSHDRDIAKQLLQKGFRDRAKLLLRKKRFQEQLLTKTDIQLENLERLTHDLEFSVIELQVVEGLRLGNEALKNVNATFNISDIERILDETREGAEKQQEINALLCGGTMSSEDEDAVELEFDSIIRDLLPDVSNTDLPALEADVIVNVPKPSKERQAVALSET